MRWRTGALAAGAALAPSAASAHLVQSGLGPFYDGLLHPLISLEDLLPVLALAVLAGLRGAGHARWLLVVVPLAWLAGFALSGPGLGLQVDRGVLLAVGAFGIALSFAAAADLRLPRLGLLLVGAVLGLAHGLVVGPDGGLLGAAGSAVTVGAVLAIVAGEIATLLAAWTRIAARVLASWTAAAGMLQLGWMLRG